MYPLTALCAKIAQTVNPRHTYKLALLSGKAEFSGADMKGKAGSYAQTRAQVMNALRAEGVRFAKNPKGRVFALVPRSDGLLVGPGGRLFRAEGAKCALVRGVQS